jgi:3-phenylpropionate/trans-cinnamate dioxygenase ferredoxin subunit
MAEFVSVGRSEEVAEGEATAFAAGDEEVAVARVDGDLYGFSDICTHRGCNLASGGEIDGLTIECECHGSVFSMETGEVINPPATEPLATFEVREVDGEIQVAATE